MPDAQFRARARQSKMEFAEAFLRARNVLFTKPDASHLKIGPLNFYPTTGTIFVDQEPRNRPALQRLRWRSAKRDFCPRR